MRPPLLIGLLALGVIAGCETREYDPDEYAACEEDGPLYNTRIDPENCGGCGIRCEAGVPCDEWRCQYNTPLHCGEPYRQCVAPSGKTVECVEHFTGEGASAPVDDFSCVPVDVPGGLPEPDAPVDPETPLSAISPQWVGIPGTSDQCMDSVDGRLCQQATVEFIDLCGSDIVQPLAYDFEIMTTEVSRAQYRKAMCGDCIDPSTELCRDVCGDLGADDQSAREALPMTRLDWCEAYDTCRALGGRLPTIQERARLEALAYGSRSLFRQETNCNAWTRETGSAPWIAECFDEPPEMLGLDRVDSEAGAVQLGVDVLLEPQWVHHLIGNAEEWLADPAEALTTSAVADSDRKWRTSTTAEDRVRPRVARGRSLFSPSGQSGSRLLVLEPSVRADDLGVRCARTVRSPFTEPTPYDAEPPSQVHATCEPQRAALRPVRRMNGQQVFRATDICFDGAATDSTTRRFFEGRLRAGLVGESFALARLTQVTGELAGLGLARFAIDEQWWLSEPADEAGELIVVPNNDGVIEFGWGGETTAVSDVCRGEMVDSRTAATDGRVLRAVELIADIEDVVRLNRASQADPAAFACGRLDCAEALGPNETCAEDCTSWRLPLAVLFERVEPFDRSEMCLASVLNPAER